MKTLSLGQNSLIRIILRSFPSFHTGTFLFSYLLVSPNPTPSSGDFVSQLIAFPPLVTNEPLHYDKGIGIVTPHGVTSDLFDDQTEAEAERSLEELLAMGMTYDELVAEGMHPAFLHQLLARIKSRSPITSQSPISPPLQSTTPDPFLAPIHTIPNQPAAQPVDLSLQVETFLDNLEPTISTSNGGDETKKRGLNPEHTAQPAKRRAFGRAFGVAVRPNELVIDVSDDESEGEENERPPLPPIKQPASLPKPRTATPPIISTSRRFVAIPKRSGLTKQVFH